MGRPRKRQREADEHDQSIDKAGAVFTEGAEMQRPEDPPQHSGQDNAFASILDAFPLDDFNFDLSAPEPLADVDSTAWDAAGMVDWNHFGDLGELPVHIQSPARVMNTDNITNPLPSTQPSFQASQSSSNVEAIPNVTPNCTCIPNLYTSLSSFQSLPSPSFPLTLGTLEKATTLARDVVRCEECPKTHVSALQNLMLLSTLLALIVNEYSRLLAHIDERAAREETITLRIGERISTETMHLHIGTPDCPMGFNLELSGAEWSKVARKAIKQAVVGSDLSTRESFTGVIEEMEQRQHSWHAKGGRAEQHGECKDCVHQESSAAVGACRFAAEK